LFGVEYLPGQYDQRADSAVACIKLIAGDDLSDELIVKYARIIVCFGELSEADRASIVKYTINPVDSREASLEKPDTLSVGAVVPDDVEVLVGFRDMSDGELLALISDMGLALSAEDLNCIRAYYKEEELRDPTVTEIRVLDTYWSDHCRHTTFMTELVDVSIGDDGAAQIVKTAFEEYLGMRRALYGESTSKPICLMDIATIGAKYYKKRHPNHNLDESEEINACSIKVKVGEEDWLVMFKNETHNHPTEIEPFGGAATCLGGAIRDPLSGRSYVYQAMRVTGSADPRTKIEDTIPGKLTQYQFTRGAAKGYSSYGNQIGLATGQVDEIYHPGYAAKRMEIGAVIGAAPAENIRRERPASGDVIILAGGRTGRDGVGGATGSSKKHTKESVETSGAEVQKGNPPKERSLQRLFRRGEVARLIKRCNDFGAGGVSVAIGELAEGIDVELDKVPKKYEGLGGTELAISESQERMAIVVGADDADAFIKFAGEEDVEATVVAVVTDTGRFRMTWRGKNILDLSRAFLDTNGARQQRKVRVTGEINIDAVIASVAKQSISEHIHEDTGLPRRFTPRNDDNITGVAPLKDGLFDSLSSLRNCSQRGLIEQFDSTIGAATVLMPLGGQFQLTPAMGMAAKLPVLHGDTDVITLMAYGFDPAISELSPFHGGAYAVLESVARIVCLGGRIEDVKLTLQEYFEKLGDDPVKWGKPFMALLGALKAQVELDIPAIGGKDSMSGTFEDISVPPTLVSFAVAPSTVDLVLSPEFKRAGSSIVRVSLSRDEDGLPDFKAFLRVAAKISDLVEEGKILSAMTCGRGGLFDAIAKAVIGNAIGAKLFGLGAEDLLVPESGTFVLEVPAGEDAFELFGEIKGASCIGETTDSAEVVIADNSGENDIRISTDEIFEKLEVTSAGFFPQKAEIAGQARNDASMSFCAERSGVAESMNSEISARNMDSGTSPRMTSDVQNEVSNDVVPVATGVIPAKAGISDDNNTATVFSRGIAQPRVFIPVFPGTNCEVDSAAAFERAGGLPVTVNLLSGNTDLMKQSISKMRDEISRSQIIMLPGGFSGGDEPDGSAKLIAAVFRNPEISEAVAELLEKRDGLILGICNGFQALIKLGLVPYGKIIEQASDAPTLTYNVIGRHVSRLVRTKIVSNLSPWLAGTEIGDVYTTPVSHGEGRFIASEAELEELARNGQIATQYVDLNGNTSYDSDVNPNGSLWSVEGITSPDGRILGKMGHVERIGAGLYKNVPGVYDTKIFESGINYFK
jgi:phosphoribosylformylglycinamidine synthase